MALKAGLIGLPNVGKSTLFKAITKKQVLVENYPFATIEPNIGVVPVPDLRLNRLQEIYCPAKLIPTTFYFVDIAGLVKGASEGEGLGNKFLAHIREVDLICHVVRSFEDSSISHVEGSVNPVRDCDIINMELIMADMEVLNNRMNKLEKKVATTKKGEGEFLAIKKAISFLNQEKPLRLAEFNASEQDVLKPYNLLTLKPLLYIINIKEEDFDKIDDSKVNQIKQLSASEQTEAIIINAQLEVELNDLSEEERKAYLNDLGINQSGLDLLIQKAYSLLGLGTFFTASSQEVRAWTFKKGMTAKNCAGIIHSDFEKGFIKADVIAFTDLEKYQDEQIVKQKGRKRLEGRDYLIEDGDICYFRFNL
jgi:GTP-binding protein YchF